METPGDEQRESMSTKSPLSRRALDERSSIVTVAPQRVRACAGASKQHGNDAPLIGSLGRWSGFGRSNHRRLHTACSDIPPVDYEDDFYRSITRLTEDHRRNQVPTETVRFTTVRAQLAMSIGHAVRICAGQQFAGSLKWDDGTVTEARLWNPARARPGGSETEPNSAAQPVTPSPSPHLHVGQLLRSTVQALAATRVRADGHRIRHRPRLLYCTHSGRPPRRPE
jgi:hypothetical protein